MGARYLSEVLSAAARAEQRRAFGRELAEPVAAPPDELGAEERALIESRDSFFLATVTPNGWPYVQHRGGPPGFLRVLDPRAIGFADLRGNRQLITAGNVRHGGRVALLLLDFPTRVRLKVLGHARLVDAAEDPALLERLCVPELRRRVERLCLIDVVGLDWNCPAYITPRYTTTEVEAVVTPLKRRIAELEAALAARRGR